jgi:transcriptional regulator with XRE-family HTH domain
LLRQLHGLSQADLAAMLGVNLKVIKALESGKGNPGFASIERIAQAFGLGVVFVKKDTVAEIVLHLRVIASQLRGWSGIDVRYYNPASDLPFAHRDPWQPYGGCPELSFFRRVQLRCNTRGAFRLDQQMPLG